MMSEALQKMASIALHSLNRSLLLDVRAGLVATRCCLPAAGSTNSVVIDSYCCLA